jgi:hypothetical protein
LSSSSLGAKPKSRFLLARCVACWHGKNVFVRMGTQKDAWVLRFAQDDRGFLGALAELEASVVLGDAGEKISHRTRC